MKKRELLKGSKKASKGNTTRKTARWLQNKTEQVSEPVKGLVVGQNWKVGADSLNIILYQRGVNKKTGKEYWRTHSYFNTVADALMGLVNQEVRDTQLKDLKAVCSRIEQLHKDILKALEGGQSILGISSQVPLPQKTPPTFRTTGV